MIEDGINVLELIILNFFTIIKYRVLYSIFVDYSETRK